MLFKEFHVRFGTESRASANNTIVSIIIASKDFTEPESEN
jgi:hypothetical protein